MARIVLNTEAFEVGFFSNMLLYGLEAAGLQDYHLCWQLNHYLGLRFCRKPDQDIVIFNKADDRPRAGTLFESDIEPESSLSYFPVFQHDLAGMDAAALLYNNRCEGRVLIPELKSVDYFLLIPQTPDAWEKEWLPYCERLPGISWLQAIGLNSLRSKRNFIL
jgi:hypothetical protein